MNSVSKVVETKEEVMLLFDFLKHGSDEHQEWLLSALLHYFCGEELLEYTV